MREERINHYSYFDLQNEHGQPDHQHRYAYEFGRYEPSPDSGAQREQFQKMNEARAYGNQRDGNRERDDHYNVMYETSNYYATPRSADYGLPHGSENDLDKVDHFSRPGWAYTDRRTPYRYNMGYNPNFDNPEEGDQYRNFESRGNHGFRHDASYGNADEFRDFGDGHYGSRNNTNRDYNRFEERW